MCQHRTFKAHVHVNRTEDDQILSFAVDVSIRCVECGAPFSFIGLPTGQSSSEPTVSPDGSMAKMPIVPMPDRRRAEQ